MGPGRFTAESLSQKIAYRIRNDYYDRLQRLSFAFHDKQATGSLMSRATADVEGVRMFVNIGAVRAMFILAMVAGRGGGDAAHRRPHGAGHTRVRPHF